MTAGNAGDASAAEAILADVLTPPPEPSDAEDHARGVYGDASYGTADLVEKLESAGVEPNVKVQPPSARDGMYSQDDFEIDLTAQQARCPAGARVSLRVLKDGSKTASFADHCAGCALRSRCTSSKVGRTIRLHPKHETLDRHRKRQRDETWKRHYRKVRPRVERKIAHLMRNKHGGRRARVRGRERVKQDFALLAASINLARLAALGVRIADAHAA